MTRRAGPWVFLALAMYGAALAGIAVHEALGHGLAALAVGGRFLAIYVSPVHGVAYTSLAGAGEGARLFSVAAGPALNVVTGLLAWWTLARARPFTVRATLFLAAAFNLLVAIVYFGLEPLLSSLMGLASQGDGSLVYGLLGLSPTLPGLLALATGVWIMARLMRWAPVLTAQGNLGHRGPFLATWTLAGPGFALLLAYLAVVFPWLGPWERAVLPVQFLVVALLTVAGGSLLWFLRRAGTGADPDVQRAGPEVPRAAPLAPPALGHWSAALAVAALAALVVFGPTATRARGLVLQAPRPQDFRHVPQRAELAVTLSGSQARLALSLLPPVIEPQPLRAAISRAGLRVGPDEALAGLALEYAATAVPSLDRVTLMDLQPMDGGWVVEGTAAVPLDELMVQIDQATLGWLTAVEVMAEGLALASVEPADTAIEVTEGRVRWTQGGAEVPGGVRLRLSLGQTSTGAVPSHSGAVPSRSGAVPSRSP